MFKQRIVKGARSKVQGAGDEGLHDDRFGIMSFADTYTGNAITPWHDKSTSLFDNKVKSPEIKDAYPCPST